MSRPSRKSRNSFTVLVLHLLGSFVGGDLATMRLLQLSVALVLPPLLYVLFALPSYSGLMPMFKLRPMRMQVGDHFVLITYAFSVCGLATLLAWERFFPTIQDLRIIGILPITRKRLFVARLCASVIFLALLLIVPNTFPGLLLAGGAGSKHPFLQLVAHAFSLTLAGLFASSFVLILLVLSRIHALLEACMQAFLTAAYIFMLLFSPVLSVQAMDFIHSPSTISRWLPQVWFTALYEAVWQAGKAAGSTSTLARIGVIATALSIAFALLLYPIAYWYQERRLMEGREAIPLHSGRFFVMPERIWRMFLPRPQQRAGFALAATTILRVRAFRACIILMLSAAAALACSFHRQGTLLPEAPMLGILSVCLMATGVLAIFASQYQPRAAWIFETSTDEARHGVFQGARFLLVMATQSGAVFNLVLLLCVSRFHFAMGLIAAFGLVPPAAFLAAHFLFHHNEFVPFTQERLLRQQTLLRLLMLLVILMPLGIAALHRWRIAIVFIVVIALYIFHSRFDVGYEDIPEQEGPQRLNLDGMSL
ncbi:hypothetical protein [Silvibacterium acidisoli]|uniref:hypothetical protein n=1 Tax=Acidobacteriaceae bacterium ZG23-2 TaxID=2883246 RepID=UPI00406C4CAA